MRKHKIIKYKAIKVVSRPVKIEFYDKKGNVVLFKAKKGYEVFDPNKLKGKQLVRWLKKNGFKELAKALKITLNHIELAGKMK